jgi:hypothetical protein
MDRFMEISTKTDRDDRVWYSFRVVAEIAEWYSAGWSGFESR